MSSSMGPSQNLSQKGIRRLATIEHAGNLIEHLSCDSEAELLDIVGRCNKEGRRILSGRPIKLPPAPAQRVDYFLTLDGAQSIIEHCRPDQVITVEAGITISALQSLLAQHNQWFPVSLPDENVSLMEFINCGNAGPLQYGFGGARELILGMQVALGSGESVRCGGKVVKNVSGYDLPKLFTGSHATLCIPYSAHLRLFALPECAKTACFRFNKISPAFDCARALVRSGLPLSSLEIVDAGIFSGAASELRHCLGAETDEFLLLTEFHGIRQVVDELERAIEEFSKKFSCKFEKPAEDSAKKIWRFLSGPAQFLDCDWLELSATSIAIESICSIAKERDAGITFSTSPACNKLLLCRQVKGEDEQLPQLVRDLAAELKEANSQGAIAYSDKHYLWKVTSLGQEDLVLSELKRRLKNEFDPGAVLNPLALL